MLFARIEPFSFRPKFVAWTLTQLLVGQYRSEERHPISRLLQLLYEKPCRFAVRHAKSAIALAVLIVASTVPIYLKLGSEFMPPLREGTLLYMPSSVEPGMSVAEAQKVLQVLANIRLEPGYSMVWSGQYENMLRVRERLKLILPLTIVLIFGLLYLNTKSVIKAGIVMLAVPFSAVGAVWFLWVLGYNVSIAVWVGLIALMGLDAETGVFMLLFLDLSHDEFRSKGQLTTSAELVEAIIHGAVKRVRPKAMTVCAAMMGLLPIYVVHGHRC